MHPHVSFVRRVRYSGLMILTIAALVAALLPVAAFAASGPVTVESSMTAMGRGSDYSAYRNYGARQNYGYNQSRSNYNYNQRNDYNNYHNQYQGQQRYGFDNSYNRGYSHRYNSCTDGHRVRRGETLSGIARRYGTSVRALTQANRIYNPNRIYAGEYLCIPDGYGYDHSYGYGYRR